MSIISSTKRIIVIASGVWIGYVLALASASWLVSSGALWSLVRHQIEDLHNQQFQKQLIELLKKDNLGSLCIGDSAFTTSYCNSVLDKNDSRITLPHINRSAINYVIKNAVTLGVTGKIFVQTPPWLWTNIADNEFSIPQDTDLVSRMLKKQDFSLANIAMVSKYAEKGLDQVFQKPRSISDKSPRSYMNADFEIPLVKYRSQWNSIFYHANAGLRDRLYWVGSDDWLLDNSPGQIQEGYTEFLSLSDFELGKIVDLSENKGR